MSERGFIENREPAATWKPQMVNEERNVVRTTVVDQGGKTRSPAPVTTNVLDEHRDRTSEYWPHGDPTNAAGR